MLGSLPILPLPAPPSDGNLGPLPLSQVTAEDSPPHDNVTPPPPPASVATHTRTIGIIHPPPDIRTIVDKTAHFVAKNGPDFEKRIIANNAGNAKFNFLNGFDPYNAYYQHRLSEFRAQNDLTPQADDSSGQEVVPSADSAGDANELAETKPDPSAQFKPVRKVLVPPEPETYTVRLPEGITGEELDIIKLTAQFVARNGKSFLTGLTSREINNHQFHFLKPTHSMFMFFTALADAYSKVLMPPKGLTEKLRNSVVDMTTVLERCLHRLEWERSQEQARLKAEDEIEQERMQMAMIDWHDFVVVEAIDFVDDEDEDLPPPMTLEEVIRRSKITSMDEDVVPVEPGKEADMEMDEEEVKLVEEGMRAASMDDNDDEKKRENKSAASEEPEAPMRIVKNWKRPEERIPAERDPTKFVVSPITGELIPISEMAEHMRISLIDPKYKEQKERMMAKIRETTLAQDDEISRNIVGLARTRPDIFGTTEEEVSNAVKAEIEKKKEEQPKQVIWDGHTGSIGRTANQAMSQGLEDQIENGNNLPGPAAPPPKPGVPSVRPLPPPPGLVLNMPRMGQNTMQYPNSGQYMQPRPPMMQNMQGARAPPPPMTINMMNRPPQFAQPVSVNPPGIPPPPPGSHFPPLGMPRPFPHPPLPPMQMMPQPSMQMMAPPPPPPDEAPPPLPEEPEPKRQKTEDQAIPEDQFLAQHPGPARIAVAIPNVDELNLNGRLLEITVQSLSETIGNLKEKIAGETQIAANKQKLSGRGGIVLKDQWSLAHCNIGAGETLTLAFKERGGRKR
ncbi:hypothetical protein MKW92_043387 [Papaver armeniacum]|nr:hypothetical protein MKW92_043387 [Papaver armeniacum]